MRKQRDGEGTKQSILEVAEELFAAKGYSGTSLQEIANKSGLSVGLIIHHFKTKEGVYNGVVEALSSRYMRSISRDTGILADEKMSDGYVSLLRAVFSFWTSDKTYERISSWAALENKRNFIESEKEVTLRFYGYIVSLQEKGKIDRNVEPYVYLTVIIGSLHFWCRYRESFKTQLGLDESQASLNDVFFEQYAHLLEKMFDRESGKL